MKIDYTIPACGHVRYWDKQTGRGMIRSTLDQNSYSIHYSSIKGRYPGNTRMDLKEGQPVNFTLIEFPCSIQVDTCEILSNDPNDFRKVGKA